jgi:hypothetical protein
LVQKSSSCMMKRGVKSSHYILQRGDVTHCWGIPILPLHDAVGSQILPLHDAAGSQILPLPLMQRGIKSYRRMMQRGVKLAAPQRMSPSLLLSQSRLSLFHSPCGIGRFTASHRWLGLAVFNLACPDLAADHHPNSNTYKSYRYASRLHI